MLNPSYKLKYLEQLVRLKLLGHVVKLGNRRYCIACYQKERLLALGRGLSRDTAVRTAVKRAKRPITHRLRGVLRPPAQEYWALTSEAYCLLRQRPYLVCGACRPYAQVGKRYRAADANEVLNQKLIELYQKYA